MQNYFQLIVDKKLTAATKIQYVDHIPKAVKGTVLQLLRSKDAKGAITRVMDELELSHVQTRSVDMLSGGELQRFAIAYTVLQEADVYLFDEPSSYLDVKQRLKAAQVCFLF